MPDVQDQKRVHDMLLGPLERPALQWLAAHLPRWATPDLMTVIGVTGTFVVFGGYLLSHLDKAFLWLVNFGFLVNWFGDSMDGTLARYRKIERPRYGFFVDHSVDAFCQVVVFLGIGVSPYVRLDVAALACIGYLLISVLSYVMAFVSGEFRVSYARMGPTEMRLIAVLANTLVFFFGNPVIDLRVWQLTAFDLAGLAIAAGLATVFVVTCVSQALKWAKLDVAG